MAEPAKQPSAATIDDVVRRRLILLIRSLVIVVPLIIILYAAYMTFYGSDPRRQLTTLDQTVTAYNEFVRAYTLPGGRRPNKNSLRDFLRFFDDKSVQFFEERYEDMAYYSHQFEPDTFKAMTDEEKRVEAMIYLLAIPPINGFGTISERRPMTNDQTSIQVRTAKGTFRVVVEKRLNLYYFTEWAGQQIPIQGELDKVKAAKPS